ncbi:MAG: helix-turn-helix transcriptional regulator [Planctomycetota bacterium]|nr:helix-turn-helix transcriptional regulator [Planctomycetota bacterium]
MYLSQGMQFRAHSGSNYPMYAGQVLVIPPGAPHSSGVMPLLPGTTYRLHIRDSGPLLCLPERDAHILRAGLLQRAGAPYALAASCRTAWEQALSAATDKTALAGTVLRHALLSVLLEANSPSSTASTDGEWMRAARHLIAADPQLAGQPHSLAHHLGLSYPGLRKRVKASTGQSLGDWLMRLRIHHAIEILSAQPERSITDLALSLGFSSSQYFATCFRRHTAMSASRFRSELNTPTGRRRLNKLRE